MDSEELSVVERGQTQYNDQLTSLFFRLPRELRDMVYTHAVGGMEFRENSSRRRHTWQVTLGQWDQPRCFALLGICRRINEEAWETFYFTNVFSFSTKEFMSKFFSLRPGSPLGQIRSLQLRLHGHNWHDEDILDANGIHKIFEEHLPNLQHLHVVVIESRRDRHDTNSEIRNRFKHLGHIKFTFEIIPLNNYVFSLFESHWTILNNI